VGSYPAGGTPLQLDYHQSTVAHTRAPTRHKPEITGLPHRPVRIHLDFETFSHKDVRVVGSYRYAADPSTFILIIAWAVEDGEVQTWTCLEDEPPHDLLRLIRDGAIICAHNAEFERAILEMMARRDPRWPKTRIQQFRCTAAKAAVLSLPRALEKVAVLLDVAEQKDKRGKALIQKFCKLHKRKHKGVQLEPVRRKPEDYPDDFADFVAYCVGDVEAERAVDKEMPDLSPIELAVFWMNMEINEEGLPIDVNAMEGALKIAQGIGATLEQKVQDLTGGIAVTQRDATLEYLQDRGVPLPNLQRKEIESLLEDMGGGELEEDIEDLLQTRMELSRAAPKKLVSMRDLLVDGRLHGTLLYHGAHTGRWTGKLFQPQNLNRGDLKESDLLRAFRMFSRHASAQQFAAAFPEPFAAIASCIRGFIAAPDGEQLAVVDYTAIEARVLVWLAGHWEKVQAYEEGLDLYKILAARLFSCHYDDVTAEQRRIGKNLILGCGYGLGWRSFITYCAKEGLVIDETFSREAVGFYRNDHKPVTEFWGNAEEAFRYTLRTGQECEIEGCAAPISFEMFDGFLALRLPSGRRLYYPQPHQALKPSMYGGPPRETLAYMGQVKSSWVSIWTYGGKIVENIVQAVARDIMALGMLSARAAGFRLVLTVHDEVVARCQGGKTDLDYLSRLLQRRPSWAASCPISAKGFLTQRYRKD